MIRSMTAFGRAVRSGTPDGKNITVELKSVNNRYLDCNVKISRIYSFLEDRVRQYIQASGISRGKLDVYIGVDIIENIGMTIDVDTALAGSYINALKRLRDEFGLSDDISVMTVAQNRDIFNVRKPEEDTENDWQIIKPTLDEAIAAFLKVREAEGERLKADILQKLCKIEVIADKIKGLSEADTAAYKTKFETRLKQIIADNDVELNSSLVLTECAIYADRVAIDEELVRLGCHFTAFRSIFESDEPVGRKLDFLLQEINRETNTIGSKASNVEIASLVVEIKSELEKIREQVQNIE
ncbi:MAG: YicC family protein [Clostridiales bacterium]|nr:YicC family protein [Clostridiales bacterium]